MPTNMACQVCGGEVPVPDDALDGELTSCPSCGQKYQVVIQNNSIQLKLINAEEEDWGE
ncbi:lysine biosynthesis protein [Thermocladium modestius]|uniref:Lysine biosynthesis protein n=1 Tax=Thermocladium modestius TaxID=62609 RepID=A0A830GVW8_9CREN|nr:alpha-aminoadipate/glutamate carrier protein LysW [Thermocladium modestius]GGP20888.1 lysine biosynthesis protein [Thermocladium modestius]